MTASRPPRPRRTRQQRAVIKAMVGLMACVCLLAVAAGSVVLWIGWRLDSHITRIDGVFDGLTDRPTRAVKAGDALNILILGTDRRSDVPTTGDAAGAAEWVPGAQRSDTIMILHIDAARQNASIISIPRDTWVDVPGHGTNKVNAAFSLGGPSLAIATVERFTGVRIDHLAVIDWSGFSALIDAVGGIEVDVPVTVSDSARDITWTAGVHELDGQEALNYVGQRYGLPHGDLDRVARQQVVLRTLMQNALHQEMRKDPRMLYGFLDTVTQHLSVDSEWSARDMVNVVASMRDFRSAGLTYFTIPVDGLGTERGQSVVYADRRYGRQLWNAVRDDDLVDWVASHPQDLTPYVVS